MLTRNFEKKGVVAPRGRQRADSALAAALPLVSPCLPGHGQLQLELVLAQSAVEDGQQQPATEDATEQEQVAQHRAGGDPAVEGVEVDGPHQQQRRKSEHESVGRLLVAERPRLPRERVDAVTLPGDCHVGTGYHGQRCIPEAQRHVHDCIDDEHQAIMPFFSGVSPR